jgi:Arc/MetJ-type ribon-helix-helix transcriptional regulator
MKMSNGITIHLTPEQERRVQDVIRRGAYDSVEEVVDAALAAVEQRTVPGFADTRESFRLCWRKA